MAPGQTLGSKGEVEEGEGPNTRVAKDPRRGGDTAGRRARALLGIVEMVPALTVSR